MNFGEFLRIFRLGQGGGPPVRYPEETINAQLENASDVPVFGRIVRRRVAPKVREYLARNARRRRHRRYRRQLRRKYAKIQTKR